MKGSPRDVRNEPLAWWTYPTLYWLEPRLKNKDHIFEWGSGNSTLWLAERVRKIVSTEDSPDWVERIRRSAPPNAEVLLRRSTGGEYSVLEATSEYVEAIREFPAEHFDVIVIDGRERNACAAAAPRYLREEGLIVFDNSDRPGAAPGLEALSRSGFLRVDFAGFVAGYYHLSCTSVLFRNPTRWLGGPLPSWLGY